MRCLLTCLLLPVLIPLVIAAVVLKNIAVWLEWACCYVVEWVYGL